jgi:CRP/FNR family transcriptional regulator
VNSEHLDIKRVAELKSAIPRQGRRIELTAPCKACPVQRAAAAAALEAADLDHLRSIASSVTLTAGQVLFSEGERADYLYSVTLGTLRLCKLMADGRRQITGFLFPGDFLGLADNESYAYSAEAVTGCTLLRYPFARLRQLMAAYPELEHKLCAIARHELAEAQDQILLLGRKTARERVASFLLQMLERATRRGLDGGRIAVPMTREDMGDYLGMATETISRILTEFRNEGMISSENAKDLMLKRPDALQRIAEGLR